MSLAVQLSALACALGAVVFATISGKSVRGLLMASVFAASLAWPLLVTVLQTAGVPLWAGVALAAALVGGRRRAIHAAGLGRPRPVEGYLMEQWESDQRQQPAQGEEGPSSGAYLPLLTGGPIVALLLVLRCWRSRLA